MAAEVKLVVRKLEGCDVEIGKDGAFSVEFHWESGDDDGHLGLGKKRRSSKMKSTSEATLDEDGVILWNEEFRNDCVVADLEDHKALRDLIEFKVFSFRNNGRPKTRLKIGTTEINLSHWASNKDGKEINLSLPLLRTRNFLGTDLLLCIALTFSNLESQHQSLNAAHKPSVSILSSPLLNIACSNKLSQSEPSEKKIVLYTRRARRISHENGHDDKKGSARNNGAAVFVRRNQLTSNGTQLSNNGASEASLSELMKGYVPSSAKRKRSERGTSKQSAHPSKVIGIEETEDECCQQATPSESLHPIGSPSITQILGYDEAISLIPQWEQINVVSRDALTELQSRVIFASIDQRSEQAGGSSACSALVVVIANWLHANKGCLPDQYQFDTLIKEGSFEWRELQKNGGLMQLYADGHFDIKTVLHLRPICVDFGKTTIGFFQPDGLPEEVLDFLPGTTSFDDLWKEICEAQEKISGNDSLVYIVGWNDHFFLLKADSESYYIIDTLGERLFEGCDRGYILKFDKDTKIYKNHPLDMEECRDGDEPELKILFSGYQCCKHYFKRFLAALPLKEAIENYKKGMLALDQLYGKLQVEFSYTKLVVEKCSL